MRKLFDIKKTQLEMVKDRGYNLSSDEEEILKMDFSKFETYYRELGEKKKVLNRTLLNRFYDMKKGDDIVKRLLVFYGSKTEQQQKQIPANVVREFVKLIQDYGVTEAVLIVDLNLSSTGEGILSKITSVRWQIFNDKELEFNPTKHIDVPKHELLSPEEQRNKLLSLRTTISNLTLINVNDPVIKYYNWATGGIVKIYRNDQEIGILSEKSITYRVIIGSNSQKL